MHQVRDWMTSSPITVDPHASALEALQQLIDGDFRHLPVVSEEGLVGIIALEDLRAALSFAVDLRPLELEERWEAREYRVGELMTYGPTSVAADTPLDVAAKILMDRRIGCLPVVDDGGKVLGIFTRSDALAALTSLLRYGERASERLGALDSLVRDLRVERRRIASDLGEREDHERELTTEAHDHPGDLADQGSALDQVGFQGTLADLAARRLVEIDRALDRHGRGALGVCTGCGGSIPLARLRALPGTDRCVRCAAGGGSPTR